MGTAVLTSPDGRAASTIDPGAGASGTVADVLAEQLARRQDKPGYRVETRQPGGRHRRSKGQWCAAVCSYNAPDRGGSYDYEWIAVVGGGGRSVVVATVYAGKEAYDEHCKATAGLINELALTTTMVVERGVPDLTRFHVDETGDFLEWLMQSPLTDAQRAMVEEELRGYWRARSAEDMQGVADLMEAREELAKLDEAQRDLAREAALDEALAECRKDESKPLARMLLEMHAAASRPIADGEPPLTRKAADALAEFLYFAAGKITEVTIQPDAATKAKFADEAAAGYADLPAEARKTVAGMPTTWAALRVAWPDLQPEARRRLVDGWRRSPAIAGLARHLGELAATKGGAAGGAGDAADARSPEQMRAALQAQQASFQMMQSVMQNNYNSMRIIASNMGGNTTYTYRW